MLKEKFGERTLPIVIGEAEAMAIAFALEGVKPGRPMTHDLIKIIMDSLQTQVTKITVVDLKDETYFAKLYLQTNDGVLVIDARPSDSVAIALRVKCPIFVENKVLEDNGVVLQGDTNVSELKRKLRDTKPEKFGDFSIENK